MHVPLLSLLVFLPLVGAIVLLGIKREQERLIKAVALGTILLVFLLAIIVFVGFKPEVAGMQFEEQVSWISQFGISYHLGLDGISLLLVLLTALMLPIALGAAWDIRNRNKNKKDLRTFVIMLLLVETGVLGMFLALDLVLFYIFWEAMLIPMYFLIGMWGGPRGSFAAIKFFIYTLAGSVLMLVSILVLYFWSGRSSFDLPILMQESIKLEPSMQLWLFLGFAVAFAIKIPLFPLHSWLPEAYAEAPTSGSILLAALFSKAGVYGFLRFGLNLFPAAFQQLSSLFLALGVVGIIYGALVAAVQRDLKKLIGYSSISHLGLIALGLFALDRQSLAGSILQMFNHGIIIAALFLLVGLLQERFNTRMLPELRGLMRPMPAFAAFFLIIMLAAVGLPGTSGFVGEFLILLGAFQAQLVYAIIGTLTVILSAIYMLWLYQKTMHESPPQPTLYFGGGSAAEPIASAYAYTYTYKGKDKDLRWPELIMLIPPIVLIFFIGLWPQPFLERLDGAVIKLLEVLAR